MFFTIGGVGEESLAGGTVTDDDMDVATVAVFTVRGADAAAAVWVWGHGAWPSRAGLLAMALATSLSFAAALGPHLVLVVVAGTGGAAVVVVTGGKTAGEAPKRGPSAGPSAGWNGRCRPQLDE